MARSIIGSDKRRHTMMVVIHYASNGSQLVRKYQLNDNTWFKMQHYIFWTKTQTIILWFKILIFVHGQIYKSSVHGFDCSKLKTKARAQETNDDE